MTPPNQPRIMKGNGRSEPEAKMLPEYDFSHGVRGQYAKRYGQGSNIVVLAPDVAEAFPNSAAVNEALRVLVAAARHVTVKP